jgi:thioredoxin-dependent peroxiredoxin
LLPEFDALGVAVVGTSVDAPARLQKFRDKYDIKFPFASDQGRTIGTAYGTLKGGPESTDERDTVVIGKDGTVAAAYKAVSAKGHAAKVLADVKQLRAEGRL